MRFFQRKRLNDRLFRSLDPIPDRLENARTAISEGANVNCKKDGVSIFIHAVRKGDHGLCVLLAESGADINARDREGKPAVTIAFDNGSIHLAHYLISIGAKLPISKNA